MNTANDQRLWEDHPFRWHHYVRGYRHVQTATVDSLYVYEDHATGNYAKVFRAHGEGWDSHFCVTRRNGTVSQSERLRNFTEALDMAEKAADEMRTRTGPMVPKRDDGPPVEVLNTQTQQAISAYCKHVEELLLEKNRSYGDSALDPVRIFSKADPVEAIRVRVDDKLSRIARGTGYPSEDTIDDLIGYLILYQVIVRNT